MLLLLTITTARAQNLPTVPEPKMMSDPFGSPSSPSPTQNQDFIERGQRQLQEHRQQQQAERRRQEMVRQILNEDAREAEIRKQHLRENRKYSVQYNFPPHPRSSGTVAYHTAFQNLMEMDSASFSVTKAVFTAEDAYFNNSGDFSYLDQGMQEIANFLLAQMKEEGQDVNSNVAKNLMIYRFFADTMEMRNGNLHLPYTYDFEDYRGKDDFTKTMVIKLIKENTGQCHSLPLLYLMIAEYMEAEAYLVNSPMHTFIKFPLPTGGYQNIELTSHIFNTNVHVVASGYLKAEAIQSKIYLQPLTEKQLLSNNLTDLAKGYLRKFGHAPFIMQILDSAIALDSTNIVAHLEKSNYLTYQFMFIERQLGITRENFQAILSRHPKAAAVLKARNAIYDKIDALGYEPMPEGAYEDWLQGMEKEVDRRANQERLLQLQKSTDW